MELQIPKSFQSECISFKRNSNKNAAESPLHALSDLKEFSLECFSFLFLGNR
jgi:hypothetical protein